MGFWAFFLAFAIKVADVPDSTPGCPTPTWRAPTAGSVILRSVLLEKWDLRVPALLAPAAAQGLGWTTDHRADSGGRSITESFVDGARLAGA